MAHVKESKDWNATGNHECSLSKDEMIDLVLRIKSDIFNNTAPPNDTHQSIKKIWNVLDGKDSATIFIKKGIHQETELHYTIGFNTSDTVHVYVKAGSIKLVDMKPLTWAPKEKIGWKESKETFEYVNSGLTVLTSAHTEVKFPALFAKQSRNQVRTRSHSFSLGNIGVIGKMLSSPESQNLHA